MPVPTSTVASFRAASARISAYGRKLQATVPQGLRLIAEEIMTDVKASSPGHGVPVDQGTLRSTGRVDPLGPNEMELSFGGAAAPYAVVQHERLDFQHKIGEARYLVRGLERWRPGGSAAINALKRMAAAAAKRS